MVTGCSRPAAAAAVSCGAAAVTRGGGVLHGAGVWWCSEAAGVMEWRGLVVWKRLEEGATPASHC
jgi:hypothetical protein